MGSQNPRVGIVQLPSQDDYDRFTGRKAQVLLGRVLQVHCMGDVCELPCRCQFCASAAVLQ